MKRSSILWALLLMLGTVGVALAHKPIFVQAMSNTGRAQAVVIPDPEVSWAVYAQLSQPGEVNYYTFAGKRGLRVGIEMSVPRIESARDFGFTVALIGKGLPSASGLPFALESEEGAVVAPESGQGNARVFDEPFTQTSYWQRQTLRAELPADETYTIAVYDPRGRSGKYILAIGAREVFSAGDIANMPSVIRRVRDFVSDPTPPTSNPTLRIELGLAAFGLVLLGTVLFVVRRSK